jgi:hypothetical protein
MIQVKIRYPSKKLLFLQVTFQLVQYNMGYVHHVWRQNEKECLHVMVRTLSDQHSTFCISEPLSVIKSIEQSPYWETNSHSASQEIPCLLWSLIGH